MSFESVVTNEPGAGQVDPAAWRLAMGAFASGVVIVTAVDGGRRVGTTVSAFSSVSLTPALLLVCLDHANPALPPILRAGAFAINVLAEGQTDLALRFANPALADPFEGVEAAPGALGLPLIGGSVAHVECRLDAVHPAGDHDILIGRGIDLKTRPGKPLVYSRGRFLKVAE